VNRSAIGVLALSLVLTSCAGNGHQGTSAPQLVPESALDGLLLKANQINTLMGTTGMTPHPPATVMGDHRNLLPNLNCLGIWQVNEAAIYGTNGWIGLRQQLLRSPDNDNWDNLVVQSVVNYSSTQAAHDFYAQSSDRWSKCTNHHVNITLNDQPLPKWATGALTKTDSELAIPATRGSGDQTRSCQRVLAVTANLIIDVQACKPQASTVTQAAAIVGAIESSLAK
jgi:hypothetical protein